MTESDAIALKRLTDLKEDLKKKLEQVEGTIQQIRDAAAKRDAAVADKRTAHWTQKIDTLLNSIDTQAESRASSFPLEKLRGMTQTKAMITIAKYYDGVLRPRDLQKLLIDAGLMKKSKNAANMTHHLIVDSDRFERVSHGLYRLKTHKPLLSDLRNLRADSRVQ